MPPRTWPPEGRHRLQPMLLPGGMQASRPVQRKRPLKEPCPVYLWQGIARKLSARSRMPL